MSGVDFHAVVYVISMADASVVKVHDIGNLVSYCYPSVVACSDGVFVHFNVFSSAGNNYSREVYLVTEFLTSQVTVAITSHDYPTYALPLAGYAVFAANDTIYRYSVGTGVASAHVAEDLTGMTMSGDYIAGYKGFYALNTVYYSNDAIIWESASIAAPVMIYNNPANWYAHQQNSTRIEADGVPMYDNMGDGEDIVRTSVDPTVYAVAIDDASNGSYSTTSMLRYWEAEIVSLPVGGEVGIGGTAHRSVTTDESTQLCNYANVIYSDGGTCDNPTLSGAGGDLSAGTWAGTFSQGDRIGVGFDGGNDTMTFYQNGTLVYTTQITGLGTGRTVIPILILLGDGTHVRVREVHHVPATYAVKRGLISA